MKLKKLAAVLLSVNMILGFAFQNVYADVLLEDTPVGSEDAGDEYYINQDKQEPEEEQTGNVEEEVTKPEEPETVISAMDVICDNTDGAGFMDLAGGTVQNGGYHGNFVKTSKAKFTCSVAEDGIYQLYVYNPNADYTADHTLVVVKEAVVSTSATADFNTTMADQWIEIGRVECSKKEDVEIIIKSTDGTPIKADAVKLVYISGDYTFDLAQLGGTSRVRAAEEYKHYYNVLLSLGIYDGVSDDFKLGVAVTRGEAARAVAGMMGMEVEGQDKKVYFKDVTPDNEFYTPINYLAQRGIVVGGTDGKFRPSDKITLKELLFLLLRVTGYDYDGFLPDMDSQCYTYAKKIGLIKGISGDLDAPVTAENMTRLLYNALDVAIVEASPTGEKVQYSTKGDHTVLTRYLDAEKDKGILTDNGLTALDGPSVVQGPENCIINGTTCKTTYNKTGNLLGQYVECYTTTDKEMLYVFATNQNTETRVRARDLLTSSPEFTKNNIVYENENYKKKSIKIPSDVYVIYNGEAMLSYSTEDLKIQEGDITCIDNNNDDKIDVMVIRDVKYYAVSKTFPASNKFMAYNESNAISLDADLVTQAAVLVGVDGKAITLADVPAESVIAYTEGRTGAVKLGYLLNVAPLRATITGIGSDSITLDGIEYNFSKSYQEVTVVARNRVSAYLNWDGEVFFVQNKGFDGENYAYLIKVVENDDQEGGFAKLMTTDGEMRTLLFADKVSLNKTKIPASGVIAHLQSSPQLVKFSVNGANEISILKTAQNTTNVVNYKGYDNTRFTMDYANTDARYVGTYRSFDGVHSIAPTTMIFRVPTVNGAYVNDEDFYSMMDYKKIKHYEIYNTKLYDFDDEYNIGAAVIYSDSGESTTEFSIGTVPVIVSEQTKMVDGNNEIRNILVGFCNGTEVRYMYDATTKIVTNTTAESGNMNAIPGVGGATQTYRGVKITDLDFGDIVQLAVDPRGMVSEMRVLYKHSVQPPANQQENMFIDGLHPLNRESCYASLYVGCGTVTEIKGDWIYYTVNAADGSGTWTRKCSTGGDYYRMRSSRNKLTVASKNDLCVGDRIIMRGYYGDPKEMIIVED